MAERIIAIRTVLAKDAITGMPRLEPCGYDASDSVIVARRNLQSILQIQMVMLLPVVVSHAK